MTTPFDDMDKTDPAYLSQSEDDPEQAEEAFLSPAAAGSVDTVPIEAADGEEVTPAEDIPLFSFSYDITREENEEALRLFQRQYVYRKNIIYTILFAALIAFNIDAVIKDPSYGIGYAILGICAAAIVFVWYNPRKMRRQVMLALEDIKDDTYICTVFDRFMQIQTVLPPYQQGEVMQPEPAKLYFGIDRLNALENERMLMLHLRKQLIYIFPKRAMSGEQQEQLSTLLSRQLGKDYKDLSTDNDKMTSN